MLILTLAAAGAIVGVDRIDWPGGDRDAGGPAPQTVKKAIWGLTEHNGVSLFPKYRDLGVGLFQTQARWDQIASARPDRPSDPNDPAYEFPAYLDAAIAEAEDYGMEVMVQIIGTPKWANGGRSWSWVPDKPSDYGDFAAAISRKYPNVDLWMAWGEPNRRYTLKPFTPGPPDGTGPLNEAQARAPRNYAQLVDAAYGALKGADPEDLVIGGNTYLSAGRPVIRPAQWIRYMELPDGTRPRMDMWGHNPYTYRKPFLESPPSDMGRIDFSDLDTLAEMLDESFPGPPLKLFLSEWGVPTKRDKDLQFSVSPETSVKWVQSAFQIVREWDRIYTLGWSVPVDTPRNPQGLMDSSLRPKPVYQAFKDG